VAPESHFSTGQSQRRVGVIESAYPESTELNGWPARRHAFSPLVATLLSGVTDAVVEEAAGFREDPVRPEAPNELKATSLPADWRATTRSKPTKQLRMRSGLSRLWRTSNLNILRNGRKKRAASLGINGQEKAQDTAVRARVNTSSLIAISAADQPVYCVSFVRRRSKGSGSFGGHRER
jgi:hypothetical protein